MRTLLKWIAKRLRPPKQVESAANVTLKMERTSAKAELIVKRVWIARPICGSFSLCELEAEGLIEYSVGHNASVVREHALQRTQNELNLLLTAGDGCPLSAFYLETEDGRELALHDDEVQQALKAGTYRWA